LQRLTLLIVFLSIIFELFIGASIAEVTVGSVKLKDYTVIQKVLPAAISYLYYDMATFAMIVWFQSTTYSYIVRYLYRIFYDDDLYLIVTFADTFSAEDFIGRNTEGFKKNLINFISVVLRAAIIIVPFSFIVYAFYQCFSVFGRTDILLWLSLALSALFFLQAFLILYQGKKIVRD